MNYLKQHTRMSGKEQKAMVFNRNKGERKMNRKLSLVFAFVMVVFLSASLAAASERQVIAGAGPSTKIVEDFFKAFSEMPAAADYQFDIPQNSIKHSGGVRSSSHNLFGRTGRPLNAEEKKQNKDEVLLARVPAAFATGAGVTIHSLNLKQLESIYTGRFANWKEVGGPDAKILILGREETEVVYSVLRSEYPFFANASFHQSVDKDPHVITFLTSSAGKYAIAFGAKPNFKNIDGIRTLTVDGFSCGVAVGLVYDLSNSNHPLVKAVKQFAASPEWRKLLGGNEDYIPIAQ